MTADRAGYVLGIDGGGSKTLALVADRTGEVLGRGTAGPSNYQGIGLAPALAALESATAAAIAAAGCEYGALAAACVGLAGVDRPADRQRLAAWAAGYLPGVPVAIVNDAQLVLAAGTPAGWGVGVICGTGSIAYARDPAGNMARAGGWGYLLGDEGSGYAIGLAALRAVLRAHDGRGPHTALTEAVLAHWRLADPPALVPQVYAHRSGPAALAELAALVEAVADAGDEVARSILHEAGGELALAVSAVMRRLDLTEPAPCALAGGVIVKGTALREAFMAAADGLGIALAPVTLVSEPAQGALRLAWQLLTS